MILHPVTLLLAKLVLDAFACICAFAASKYDIGTMLLGFAIADGALVWMAR